jgi:catechol 2,3-dioxygenase-like lactoylglutathione lyase family enzyme
MIMPRGKKKNLSKRARGRRNSSNRRTTPWVASVPVVVSDRESSKRWYTEKLGLALISEEDHWVTVGGGRGKGSQLHLCQASENQPEPIPLEPGPSGIVIVLPGDFVKSCKRLEEAGVEFSHLPEKAPWGWYATIRDPDGNEHYLAPAS